MFKKILFFIFSLFSPIICEPAYATDNFTEHDTYISSMESKITATSNFRFHIQQKITAHLKDDHGIFINIAFKPEVNVIKNINVKGPGNYEVSTTNKNNQGIKTIKIGDKDKKYNGNKTWILSYYIQGLQKTLDSPNNLSLSLVPTYWELPIKKAKTTVIMPKTVNWEKMQLMSGYSDNTPISLKFDSRFKINKTEKSLTIKGENLPKKYGATISGNLPKNYWKSPIILNHIKYLMFIIICLPIIISLFYLIKFRQSNKPIETIEFYPPDKMDPITMGYIIDGYIDNKDIISMLFYFANEGFIKIKETNKNLLTKNFQFIKINKKKGYTNYQKTLLEGLFSKENIFETNNISNDFIICLDKVKDQVTDVIPNPYDKKSLITTNILLCLGLFIEGVIYPIIYKIIGYDLNIILIFLLGLTSYFIYRLSRSLNIKNRIEGAGTLKNKLILGFMITIYLCIFSILYHSFLNISFSILYGLLFVIYFIAIYFIRKRDDTLISLDGKILGFKKFIQTAELDQLNSLIEENPEYFYNILPYAYIFGLTDKWATHFEHITSYQPSWYDGEPLSYNEWNDSFCHTIDSTEDQIQIDENKEWIFNSDSSDSSIEDSFGNSGGGVW